MSLINTIAALTHDGFEVAFRDDGYNCNMVILRYHGRGGEVKEPIERRVVLPDSHLDDGGVEHYLKVMSNDPIFPR
jgi:hypothetical protein